MKQIEEMIEKKLKEFDKIVKDNTDYGTIYKFFSSALLEVHHKGQQDLVERICQDMFNSTALVLGLEYVVNLKKEVLGGELEPIKSYKKGIADCVNECDKRTKEINEFLAITRFDESRPKARLDELDIIKQQLLKLGEG